MQQLRLRKGKENTFFFIFWKVKRFGPLGKHIYIYIHDEQSLVIDNETVKMIGGKRGISFPERIVRYRVFVTVMDGQDKNLRMFLARVHPSTKKTIRLGYLAARSYG